MDGQHFVTMLHQQPYGSIGITIRLWTGPDHSNPLFFFFHIFFFAG